MIYGRQNNVEDLGMLYRKHLSSEKTDCLLSYSYVDPQTKVLKKFLGFYKINENTNTFKENFEPTADAKNNENNFGNLIWNEFQY